MRVEKNFKSMKRVRRLPFPDVLPISLTRFTPIDATLVKLRRIAYPMSKPKIIKVKIYGDSSRNVLLVLNRIWQLYSPNATQSDVKRSHPQGYHAFLTLYLEGE
jgi:hypothetical protein